MLKLDSVLVFSKEPQKLVAFYSQVVGAEPAWHGGDFSGYRLGSAFLVIGPHSEVGGVATDPKRIIVNFASMDVRAEFERVKALGATVIAEPYQPGESPDMWLCTFADPDGNYFQIGSEMKM